MAALLDPNVVKVVTDLRQRALYFSRAPIPWSRDGAPAGLVSQRSYAGARRHLGIYAYRVAALLRLAALPPSALEQLEKLEQLRALEHGMDIRVARRAACRRRRRQHRGRSGGRGGAAGSRRVSSAAVAPDPARRG